tara:strand:+ start:1673 stop:2299 length:627 start_codon:yes stop_codon:yes gene_type:complete
VSHIKKDNIYIVFPNIGVHGRSYKKILPIGGRYIYLDIWSNINVSNIDNKLILNRTLYSRQKLLSGIEKAKREEKTLRLKTICFGDHYGAEIAYNLYSYCDVLIGYGNVNTNIRCSNNKALYKLVGTRDSSIIDNGVFLSECECCKYIIGDLYSCLNSNGKKRLLMFYNELGKKSLREYFMNKNNLNWKYDIDKIRLLSLIQYYNEIN